MTYTVAPGCRVVIEKGKRQETTVEDGTYVRKPRKSTTFNEGDEIPSSKVATLDVEKLVARGVLVAETSDDEEGDG